MLILGRKKEPQRITLREAVSPISAVRKGRKIVTPATPGEPEAFVVMAPITAPMRRRAARAVRRMLGSVEDMSTLDADVLMDAGELGSRELIRLALIDWGGLGGPDGKVLDVTPDRETRFATANAEDRPTGSIDLLLADEALVAIIDEKYVRADALRSAEKNASSASPNGIGGAATRGRTTAGSPANRKERRTAAKSVRTASTRSKAKRARGSGKR